MYSSAPTWVKSGALCMSASGLKLALQAQTTTGEKLTAVLCDVVLYQVLCCDAVRCVGMLFCEPNLSLTSYASMFSVISLGMSIVQSFDRGSTWQPSSLGVGGWYELTCNNKGRYCCVVM